MSTLYDTERPNPPLPDESPGIVQDDKQARDMSCPVCGSGSTYQTQDGRWGCTQCHSTWS